MKIKKNQKKNQKLLGVALAALFVIGVLLAYFYIIRKPLENTPASTAEPYTSEQDSDKKQADNLENNPEVKELTPNSDRPETPTNNESGKKQVQMVASADKSSDTVFIRGGVNYPVADGSCYAMLRGPSGQTIRKDTTTLQNASTTDCKTITISKVDLVSGKWSFKLYYTSDNYEGVSDETSFTI